MIKKILIIIIFFNFNICFSQDENHFSLARLQGSKEIPLELNLLIESIQNSSSENQNDEIQKKMLPIIYNIDSYARVLTKEDIFFIGKIEIYKTILKSDSTSAKAIVDGDSLKILKDAIKKSNDPFITWFLKALLQDSENLLSSPKYKDYVLQKNNARLETLELRKIDKKVKLIYRWISKINTNSVDFQEILKAELLPLMIESLKNIEENFYLMASQSSLIPFPGIIKSPNELKFFSLKEIKQPPKKSVKNKSVEDILAPITDEDGQDKASLPEPSKEDWLNDDNAPTNLKNLPKPTDDADWLQDF